MGLNGCILLGDLRCLQGLMKPISEELPLSHGWTMRPGTFAQFFGALITGLTQRVFAVGRVLILVLAIRSLGGRDFRSIKCLVRERLIRETTIWFQSTPHSSC